MNLPIEYAVVEQVTAQPNLLRTILSLTIGKRVIRYIPDGFVLVKMAAAPFNPSDIAFLQGSYNVKKPLPAVPGFEGAGIVVAVGDNVDGSLIGRKVSCFAGSEGDGTWAEYLLARPEQLLAFENDLSWEMASTLLVNPFTAWAMFELAKQSTTRTIALNAAGSRVAYWLRTFAQRYGISVIDVVRKPETAAQLVAKGSQYVLVSTDEKFQENFHHVTRQLDCTMAFDAVGGSLGAQMLNAMPPNSRLVVYGGLSNLPLGDLDVLGLIFKGKKVEGFDLNQWWASNSSETKLQVAREISLHMLSRDYQGQISQSVRLDDVVSGLRHYLGHMSQGKVLLSFDPEVT
ncbi:MAG TPA: alcohol dehydrogenase catalytic domain-containing protein [Bacteroidales bacterium]|nr:alcohol dehydrogenase catalytic domain-containing protein [Bacteroidales bacterium]